MACEYNRQSVCPDYPEKCYLCSGYRRPTRYYSTEQEKHIAKELGGKRQSNSGATTFQKGDVVTEDWLIEAKTVTKEQSSFSIKKEWLEKNKEEAFGMRKRHNALAFNFGDDQNYYVVDEKTFKKLIEALRECEKES